VVLEESVPGKAFSKHRLARPDLLRLTLGRESPCLARQGQSCPLATRPVSTIQRTTRIAEPENAVLCSTPPGGVQKKPLPDPTHPWLSLRCIRFRSLPRHSASEYRPMLRIEQATPFLASRGHTPPGYATSKS
jgi:hypothetical protein